MSYVFYVKNWKKKTTLLSKVLLNKTEVLKHVTIRNNKTLKDDQPLPTNNNQKLVVNDTSNTSNPNEWVVL